MQKARKPLLYTTTDKNSRSERSFLAKQQFLLGFWHPPGLPGVSRDVPGASQKRSFFLFFRLFCSPVASELLLGSPGTVSGQFFIDFRLILARFWSISSHICCQFAVVLLPLLDRFWIVFFARARFSNVFFDRPCEKKL